jgi:hypothetical protein
VSKGEGKGLRPKAEVEEKGRHGPQPTTNDRATLFAIMVVPRIAIQGILDHAVAPASPRMMGEELNEEEEDEARIGDVGDGACIKRKNVSINKRTCRHPGCTKVIKSQGHCQRHGAKAKRCRVDGCDKQAQGTHEGMCKRHFKVRSHTIVNSFFLSLCYTRISRSPLSFLYTPQNRLSTVLQPPVTKNKATPGLPQ